MQLYKLAVRFIERLKERKEDSHMSNEMNATTPISSSRAKMAEELEKKRKEAAAHKGEKVKDKKPSEKEVKRAKAEAENAKALAIFGQAIQGIKTTDYTNYNDYKAACEDAFQKEVDARKATADTTDDLTPEQIKIAQKYMKSNEFKAAKKEIKFNNQNYIRSLQADVDGVKKGERKQQTDAILKQNYEAKEAELKQQFENKEIDEKQYKELRKANKEEYNDYKKANGTTSGFQRFFGKKEKAGDRIHNVGAKQENLEVTREFMTSGKEGAVESRIKPELMAKLKAAGYDATPESMKELYEIYDNNSGTDATVNYSYKPKQEGERDQLLASLNENLPEGAQEFEMDDVKDLGRALGYKVEKAVDFGKTMRDVGRATPLGAAAGFVKVSSSATAIAGEAFAASSSTVPVGAIAAPVILGAAAGVSAYQQYHRVEDRAIPTDVPISVNTIDEYNAYLDKQATPEGARLGKAIAKHYVNPYTNEFDWSQLNTALAKASGTVDTIGTPCNYEEAEALLTGLESGKIKPNFEKPVESKPVEEPKPVYQVANKPVQDERDIPTHDYTVKAWDNWDTVLSRKYPCADIKKVRRYFKDAYFNELKEQGKLPAGVTSSKDGFFYPAGYTWKLPEYIVIDGEECHYQDNAVPQNKRSSGSTKTIKTNISFRENYERDSWNTHDITNGGNRTVAQGQASQAAASQSARDDAKINYPGAKKVEIQVVPAQ